MARELKPTDAGYAALLLDCDLDVEALTAALFYLDPDEEQCELEAWGEGADVLRIDSEAGLSDPGGLGFVAGWSQKKGD